MKETEIEQKNIYKYIQFNRATNFSLLIIIIAIIFGISVYEYSRNNEKKEFSEQKTAMLHLESELEKIQFQLKELVIHENPSYVAKEILAYNDNLLKYWSDFITPAKKYNFLIDLSIIREYEPIINHLRSGVIKVIYAHHERKFDIAKELYNTQIKYDITRLINFIEYTMLKKHQALLSNMNKELYIGLALSILVIAVIFFNLFSNRLILNKVLKYLKHLNIIEKERSTAIDKLGHSNEELKHFAYIASHDLHEPLRMITSYSQLIASRYKDKLDETGVEFINYVVEGTDRMGSLIDGLSQYTKIESNANKLQEISAQDVLQASLDNLKILINEKKVNINYDYLPKVYGDQNQIIQVFQNLITNAIKYCPNDRTPSITIGYQEDNKDIKFYVKDNGIGISKQHFDKIFKVFQRLHKRNEYSGVGIGLALCKKIIARHHGSITVESIEGKGTTFFFTLQRPKPQKQELNNDSESIAS